MNVYSTHVQHLTDFYNQQENKWKCVPVKNVFNKTTKVWYMHAPMFTSSITPNEALYTTLLLQNREKSIKCCFPFWSKHTTFDSNSLKSNDHG